jgi:hypothetical protein
MALHHANTVLGIITEVTIGTVTFVVCDVACVGVLIGSLIYHGYFMSLP